MKEKRIVEQTSCPVCDSSDAFTIYEQQDGKTDATCFSCDYFTKDPYKESKPTGSTSLQSTYKTDNFVKSSAGVHQPFLTLDEALAHPIRPIPERKLTQATCERFGVRIGVDMKDGFTPVYYLFPRTRDSEIYGYVKKEVKDKKFSAIGDTKNCEPFGYSLLPEKGKKLFITEGAEDAMSIYQCLKENSNQEWEPNVIALLGSKQRIKNLSEYSEHLRKFDEIILVLDNDTAGKEATKDLCKMFSGKAHIAKISEKDPSDMLMKGKGVDLKWAVLTNARKYQPDGILRAKDGWDRYKQATTGHFYPYPSSMPGLNDKMYGAKPGSVVTVTSGTGAGKTQFMRELAYHFWSTTEEKLAIISLEEDAGDSLAGLLALHVNKRITLPDVQIEDEEEEKEAYKSLYDDDRITLYDYFGGMDDDNLFSKLRYYIDTGHKFIFLDHLSIIVSEYAGDGDERKRIDVIMTKLAKLAKETGAVIFLVVHLRNPDNKSKSFELGAHPTSNDLRGSGGIKQLSWDIIGLSRNQQHPDERCRNTSKIHVLKCRSTGRTGEAGYLYFDDNTGRMLLTSEPQGY